MFKAVITEERSEMQGTTIELLAGLACYIDALKNNNIPEFLIRETIEMAMSKGKSEKKEETVIDTNGLKVHKYDLNNMSKEEAKDLIEKEIFKMLD